MHFLSLPFGSACNFLVSPFFYKVCTSMLVRYDSELIVRVILNDHFTKKKGGFFPFISFAVFPNTLRNESLLGRIGKLWVSGENFRV